MKLMSKLKERIYELYIDGYKFDIIYFRDIEHIKIKCDPYSYYELLKHNEYSYPEITLVFIYFCTTGYMYFRKFTKLFRCWLGVRKNYKI